MNALFLTTCLRLNPVDHHYYGTITKGKTWADNENVLYTDLNDNFDDIYNEFNGNIEDANIKTGAAIALAKITGTAVNLSSTQTVTGVKSFDKELVLKEQSTPSNPSSTYHKLYPKSDGLLYMLDSSGNETLVAGTDGWTKETNTLTYASSTTFTISGIDLTSRYTPGTRIKFTQTTVKYFIVVSSSFSTDTTVTVTGGADYSVANASITSPYYSYQQPPDFPAAFNYAPTWTGFSSAPTGNGRFYTTGRRCFVTITPSAGGTSNTTGLTVTGPFVATQSDNMVGSGQGVDNGTILTTPCRITSTSSSAAFTVHKTFDNTSTSWTNSGSKNLNASWNYEF